MRVLSEGRVRSAVPNFPWLLILSGVIVLSMIGAGVVVRALVEWLT